MDECHGNNIGRLFQVIYGSLLSSGMAKFFKKYRSHHSILDARRVTLCLYDYLQVRTVILIMWCLLLGACELIQFCLQGYKTAVITLKILGATAQNLVTHYLCTSHYVCWKCSAITQESFRSGYCLFTKTFCSSSQSLKVTFWILHEVWW